MWRRLSGLPHRRPAPTMLTASDMAIWSWPRGANAVAPPLWGATALAAALGTVACGVLYTTRDRAAGALPEAVPYVVTATGSASVSNVHVEADAPPALAGVEVSGTPIKDIAEVRTGAPIALAWAPGDAPDLV